MSTPRPLALLLHKHCKYLRGNDLQQESAKRNLLRVPSGTAYHFLFVVPASYRSSLRWCRIGACRHSGER